MATSCVLVGSRLCAAAGCEGPVQPAACPELPPPPPLAITVITAATTANATPAAIRRGPIRFLPGGAGTDPSVCGEGVSERTASSAGGGDGTVSEPGEGCVSPAGDRAISAAGDGTVPAPEGAAKARATGSAPSGAAAPTPTLRSARESDVPAAAASAARPRSPAER